MLCRTFIRSLEVPHVLVCTVTHAYREWAGFLGGDGAIEENNVYDMLKTHFYGIMGCRLRKSNKKKAKNKKSVIFWITNPTQLLNTRE